MNTGGMQSLRPIAAVNLQRHVDVGCLALYSSSYSILACVIQTRICTVAQVHKYLTILEKAVMGLVVWIVNIQLGEIVSI